VVFPQNLMRDAGISPAGNFHSVEITAAEALNRGTDKRVLTGGAGINKRSVDIP
jgi:hypothetical protein